MSSSHPQASTDLQQLSNVPNCRHALAGCNLVSLQLSSLPKLGQLKHTCCSVRQKHTSIANNFSIKWCLGCWLLGQPWMGQHTSLQHVFCLWLASQTVRQPSQAMHAVKALHGLRLLHGDIRESNILCIFEAEQSCKVILIDLGQSRLCTQESAFQQELLQTQQLFT